MSAPPARTVPDAGATTVGPRCTYVSVPVASSSFALTATALASVVRTTQASSRERHTAPRRRHMLDVRAASLPRFVRAHARTPALGSEDRPARPSALQRCAPAAALARLRRPRGAAQGRRAMPGLRTRLRLVARRRHRMADRHWRSWWLALLVLLALSRPRLVPGWCLVNSPPTGPPREPSSGSTEQPCPCCDTPLRDCVPSDGYCCGGCLPGHTTALFDAPGSSL